MNNDVLMHWKYIKRERKNGKWVYTYPDGSKHTVGRTLDTLGYHHKAEAIDKLTEYQLATAKAKAADNHPRNADEKKKKEQAARDAAFDADRALREYYKTPVGRLDKLDDKIDAGRNVVAKLLQKKLPEVSKKIRAKDEYLNELKKRK